jgi:hypothetical protein
MKVEELISQYPRAYHMAESGTWDSIREHGLLSTVALLDLFEINGKQREALFSCRRPESVAITHRKHGRAVIRDQKPMSESALRKCLDHSVTPAEWYRILNRRVFFWLSSDRLDGLLSARAYREKQHCVLTLETSGLVRAHAERITLSPINSGSTIFKPQPRGLSTFQSISDYPFEEWCSRRARANAVVELAIDYAVPNVKDFVLRVDERKGEQVPIAPTITVSEGATPIVQATIPRQGVNGLYPGDVWALDLRHKRAPKQ